MQISTPTGVASASAVRENASRPKAVDRRSRVTSWFIGSAGVLLALVGLAKAFNATGSARALDAPDPLLGLSFRHLMLLVGLAELLLAFFCLFTPRRWLSLSGIAWLSTNFLLYRIALWFIGWHRPCGCMGSLTGLLHLSPQAADNIMKGVLAYLLIGSYLLLAWEWQGRRSTILRYSAERTEALG